jgi:capsular exopolysaccharide synthesis family protein
MSKFIMENDLRSPAAEAYKMIRTNVQFASFDTQLDVIMVTSSNPGEGKTTTAANLAISIADMEKSTLLIDCDLRKPSIHRMFKISNRLGLTNLLLGECQQGEVIVKRSQYLDILTSGSLPPNPAEVLGSKRMKAFIENMKEKYDYVILDTPPVMAVTDAQIISTMSDGVLLVAASKETSRDSLIKTKELLTNVKANIIGVILNKYQSTDKRDYGYYYDYGTQEKRRRKK